MFDTTAHVTASVLRGALGSNIPSVSAAGSASISYLLPVPGCLVCPYVRVGLSAIISVSSPFPFSMCCVNVCFFVHASQSIGLISISSFSAAAILLAGLFCYDIFWVFGTEVMVSK